MKVDTVCKVLPWYVCILLVLAGGAWSRSMKSWTRPSEMPWMNNSSWMKRRNMVHWCLHQCWMLCGWRSLVVFSRFCCTVLYCMCSASLEVLTMMDFWFVTNRKNKDKSHNIPPRHLEPPSKPEITMIHSTCWKRFLVCLAQLSLWADPWGLTQAIWRNIAAIHRGFAWKPSQPSTVAGQSDDRWLRVLPILQSRKGNRKGKGIKTLW